MNPELQILRAAARRKLPEWKAVALVAQSQYETGNWNPKSKSIYNLTKQTNGFGMKCPKKDRPHLDGCIVSTNGSNWATYKNLYFGTLDRLDWEKQWTRAKPYNANTFEEYVQKVGECGYWGKESQYPQAWKAKYLKTYDKTSKLYRKVRYSSTGLTALILGIILWRILG